MEGIGEIRTGPAASAARPIGALVSDFAFHWERAIWGFGDRRAISLVLLALAGTVVFPNIVRAQAVHEHNEQPAVEADYAPQSTSRGPFDLGIQVTRSDGVTLDLADLKGSPTIMTMFFASCPGVCPLMTEHIQQIEKQIPADELKDLQVVFISFDERDGPSVLSAYRKAHGIDSPRWTLAVAPPAESQALGDVLGVRFLKLPNGSFNHTAMVDLIDASGTIIARVPAPSLNSALFREAVRALIAMPH